MEEKQEGDTGKGESPRFRCLGTGTSMWTVARLTNSMQAARLVPRNGCRHPIAVTSQHGDPEIRREKTFRGGRHVRNREPQS